MAINTAAGNGQFTGGNYLPEIWSKRVQLKFRKKNVALALCNSEYSGEIKESGDTVHIIKEPTLTVAAYNRGQNVTFQDLTDDELTLVIDKANYGAFKMDDVDKKMSHIGWIELATDELGYRLSDAMDSEVLSYMASNVDSGNLIGSTTVAVDVRHGAGSGEYTPHQLVNRFKRLLDEDNVPEEGRWFVADPVFYEQLSNESAKLMDASVTGGSSALNNGRYTSMEIAGFKLYKSNNLPTGGDGPSSTSGGSTNYGTLMGGHLSSTTIAETLLKTEKARDPDSFADIVKSLHVYGRRVLRPTAFCVARYCIGS